MASTTEGYNGDNIQATSAKLNTPHDVVLDDYGNLYISDRNNHRIRKVDVSTGVITTVVGTGTASSTGDGASATSASAEGVCYSKFDSSGNLFLTECEGSRVRKVTTVTTDIPTAVPSTASPTAIPTTATPTIIPTVIPTATPSLSPTYFPSLSPHSITIITTIAGTGTASYSGDNGQATSAAIKTPTGIVIDSTGDVYFNDYDNHRVRKITIMTGIITTYAGTGATSHSGDGGVGSSASFNRPNGLCIDASGT